MKNIIVLGGDGFVGWPTALRLSKNFNIIIVDNLARRFTEVELGCDSLTPIEPSSSYSLKAPVRNQPIARACWLGLFAPNFKPSLPNSITHSLICCSDCM